MLDFAAFLFEKMELKMYKGHRHCVDDKDDPDLVASILDSFVCFDRKLLGGLDEIKLLVYVFIHPIVQD